MNWIIWFHQKCCELKWIVIFVSLELSVCRYVLGLHHYVGKAMTGTCYTHCLWPLSICHYDHL
jgi:hypothetical protein